MIFKQLFATFRKNISIYASNLPKMCYYLGSKNSQKKKGENAMHSVFDVAKYILHKQGPITTMKLQKLVYYAQAWSLAWDDQPLFDEDFQAWANGPVCPPLFSSHRGLFVVSENNFLQANVDNFAPNEQETIEKILMFYGDKDPVWLSNLTHSERPWRQAREGYPAGAVCNVVIDKETMRDYYGGL